MTRHFIFFVVAMLTSYATFAQGQNSDSLLQEIYQLRRLPNFKLQDTTHIRLLNNLAVNYRFYKPDSLKSISEEMLNYSHSLDYSKGQIWSNHNLGDYHLDKGEQKQAKTYFKTALQLAKKEKNYNLAIVSHLKLAQLYEYDSQYDKALKEDLQALELSKKTNNNAIKAQVHRYLAVLYFRQFDFEQALHYYTIEKEILDKGNDSFRKAQNLINLGDLYNDLGEFDKAFQSINTSIAEFEKNENFSWLTYAYMIKGNYYLKQGKYNWALVWYKNSEVLYNEKVKKDKVIVFLYSGFSQAYLGINNIDKAYTYAIKGFKLSKQINNKMGVRFNSKNLYQIHKKKKEFKKALAFQELYEQVSDSLTIHRNSKGMGMLKVMLEHEEQQKAVVEENKKRLAKQKMYIYASLAFLLLLLVVTLLLLRNYRIRKKLNQELNQKKNILEKQKVALNNSNETKDKLFSIIGHDLRAPIGALQSVLQMFKSKDMEQQDLINFVPKLKFDIDHISFTLNNLLTWGQTQMKGITTIPTSIPMYAIVTDNINLLSEIAKNKKITMHNQLVEETYAWADINQINIVIRNLISNALKFTPNHGEITIDSNDKDDYLEITIRDTGVGMDDETLSKIFNTKTSITTYGTNNEKGTGLGLSLCKEMVENNKGRIWAESVLNKGTTFYFTIPKKKTKQTHTLIVSCPAN